MADITSRDTTDDLSITSTRDQSAQKKRRLDVSSVDVKYKTIIDEPSSYVTYIGIAAAGSLTSDAVWQILKVSVSGTVTTKESADGDFNFNNVWDNRVSLSYS